jgi:predicted metal-binding membrane protein
LQPSAVEAVFHRDRLVVAAALVAVIIASWAYLLAGAGMGSDAMEWSAAYFALMAIMWVVMMMAMMLPAASPMVLLHAAMQRKRSPAAGTGSTVLFVAGYCAVWAFFSLAAALFQWALAASALMSPMMQTSSRTLAATLFMAAGVYQWTPLKQSCLRHCRSPLDFVMTHWREGKWGSFVMGVQHGGFCLGCCWALMLLLFAGGLMNLVWVCALAVFVLIEKLAPAGHWLGRLAGLALIGWGGFALIAAK